MDGAPDFVAIQRVGYPLTRPKSQTQQNFVKSLPKRYNPWDPMQKKEIPTGMQKSFLERLLMRAKDSGDAPVTLNLQATVRETPSPKPLQPKPDLVPGNFLMFGFFIELKIGGVSYLGFPNVPTRNTITGVVRWGAKLEDNAANLSKPRIPWVDDPERGFSHRTLVRAEDALGAEGTVADKRLRFEQILDLGNHVVVFALYGAEQNFRMAYGFDRAAFDPAYVRAARSPERNLEARRVNPQ